ncbi:hypothetical protein OIU84_020240 [Salix udensis]|uniref:Uncharacterized protein n=1 Tax=Salix udensis TaxID=889485 RepID=A0AAD6PK15_9ROSI|nr:hypothetical protein OIU84_020240 [Salix udensis]
MTSAQEKWSQSECPRVQLGPVGLNSSLSWISPVAAAAGIASRLACHPHEVLKIYKDGGIGAFYAGISPALMGMLPCSTCYYFMYETIKTSYCEAKNKKSLNRPEMLLIGALATSIFQITFISQGKCGDLS